MKNEELSGEDAKQEYRHREFVTTFKEERRTRRFDGQERPKNALEEKYRRKPAGDRFGDKRDERRGKWGDKDDRFETRRDDRRGKWGDKDDRRGKFDDRRSDEPRERVHNEEFSKRVVRFREPKLSAENERPIVKGRRNGWRRKDLPETNND